MCWLLKENTDEIFLSEYGSDAFNYGVEILNKAPESLEAYYSMFLIPNNAFKSYKDKIEKVYFPLHEKHFSHIDDPDFEPGEKLIYLMLYGHGVATSSIAEHKQHDKKVYEVLNIMKDNCKNKNYAALATAMLFLTRNDNDRMNCINFFLEKFNKHPAIPDVKLLKIIYTYELNKNLVDSGKINKSIEEINNLIKEYGNTKLPHGWHFSMDCYNQLFYCYDSLKDYNNAKKYYELIKKEAPNSWNLNEMKEYIDDINPQNPDKVSTEGENK